jgi:two-component sensor histidine kinase
MKFIHILIFGFLYFVSAGQIDKQKFYADFIKADVKNKVRLTASVYYKDLKEVYPQIKDSLEKIKKLIYRKSESKEGKFLFSLIDANLEIADQNYARAVFIVENGIQSHASNINDSLKGYSILKFAFAKIRNFIKAYEINSKMEMLWSRKSDSVNVDFGMNKSSIYSALNFYKEAIKERRIEFFKKYSEKDTEALASLYNDVGVYFNRLKNSDSAEVCFLRAKETLNSIKYSEDRKTYYDFFKALVGGNLGLSYYNKGQIAKAMPLLKQDIYFSLKYHDYGSAFNSYILMVECLTKNNNKEHAKLYLDSAENILEKHLNDLTPRLNFLFLKSNFYKAQGDFAKANLCLNQYLHLKDSLSLLEKEQNILNTGIAFKIEQKESELRETNEILEQKTLEDARNKTSRAYLLAGIILLSGIIVLLMLRNYFSKKRELDLHHKNEKIKAQNIQIEQSLKEKEVLIREIHHRVKNNLQIVTSMLSLQISKEPNKETQSILNEAKQRINAIALTHQMLYQNSNLSRIPINEYLEKLVRQIESVFPPSGVQLSTHLNSPGSKVNIDNAVPLGLLINELLTNAYKHAFPGNEKGVIKITLNETEKDCIIGIKDNGIGLPEDFNSGKKNSMGMDLINILAEQIDAKLVIQNKNGSDFVLEIPKEKIYL